MSTKESVGKKTEADIESGIDAALKQAFPLLPRGSLSHQTHFSFKFGGKEITIDGTARTSAQARSDIIISLKGRPLAVLELKRPGLDLSIEDQEQGLSYARVMFPSPPLVLVSNGQDSILLATHTGKQWDATATSDQAVAELLKSAARVSEESIKAAVDTLMATNPEVWVQAMRLTSQQELNELSGDWSQRELPFVRDFLIPRKATAEVKHLLKIGRKLILVRGQPLIGKSNVLRELAYTSWTEAEMVVMFIESSGPVPVLRQISDILSRELNWPVTAEEARSWLKRLSNSNGPQLVIAIDGVGLDFAALRDQIEDLCSAGFGPKLAITIELDEVIATRIVQNSTERRASRIGRIASSVGVSALDAEEFKAACFALQEHRIAITKGGLFSPELRLPWVLRAVTASLIEGLDGRDANVTGVIPPLLSLNLIGLTRNRFRKDHELRRRFKGVAAAMLEDAVSSERPVSIVLEALYACVVLRRTLESHLSGEDISRLIDDGLLKPIEHGCGESVLFARLPELVASEAASVLARDLNARIRNSPVEAAMWLADVASSIPFGDIVAAQAIVDCAQQYKGMSVDLVIALMDGAPKTEGIPEGAVMAAHVPGFGVIDMNFERDGVSVRDSTGKEHRISFNPTLGAGVMYRDVHAWLILSHLASVPFESVNVNVPNDTQRLDPIIMLRVGCCLTVLRRPVSDPEMNSYHVHDLPDNASCVCHHEGIIEPITFSIVCYLEGEGANAADWIDEVLSRNSMPLLARVDIALRYLVLDANEEVSSFAHTTLTQKIGPAFAICPDDV